MNDEVLKKKVSVFKKTGIRTCKFTHSCDSELIELTDEVKKSFQTRNHTPYIQDGFNGDYEFVGRFNIVETADEHKMIEFVCPKCENC